VKKAFSLMEVIISITILSFVMLTLIQIKNENIFMVSKNNEKSRIEEYALLAIDFNDDVLGKNENIWLLDIYNFENNNDIRNELKDIAVEIKDEIKNIKEKKNNMQLQIEIFYREINLVNFNFNKKIYSFSLNLLK